MLNGREIIQKFILPGMQKSFLEMVKKFADAWGLIAAPLGKKSNINRLYYDVLNPIWQDFLIRNIDIEDRISEYEKAREEFTKQPCISK